MSIKTKKYPQKREKTNENPKPSQVPEMSQESLLISPVFSTTYSLQLLDTGKASVSLLFKKYQGFQNTSKLFNSLKES